MNRFYFNGKTMSEKTNYKYNAGLSPDENQQVILSEIFMSLMLINIVFLWKVYANKDLTEKESAIRNEN